MSYRSYLRGDRWKSKKSEYYSKRFYRCRFCGENKQLHLHHTTYENVGNEDVEDLIYLCSRCHKYAHVVTGSEKEKLETWLAKIRKRNINNRKKFGEVNWKRRAMNRARRRAKKRKKYGI